MKIAYWDIETTDLNPEFGRIICASVLSLPSDKMTTWRQDKLVKQHKAKDMSDDEHLVLALRDFLEIHHLTLGWYSKGFDMMFINTRLMAHGLKPIRPHLHLDPMWQCKGWRGIKASNAKLGTVARFLELEESKLVVSPQEWIAARGGNREAMNKVQERCESDVRLTREVTEKLLDAGLIRNIERYP